MRVVSHDWKRRRWWTRFIINWVLYVFSFVFLYRFRYMSSSTLAFLIFPFICISRTCVDRVRRVKVVQILRSFLPPFLFFFVYHFSSFRKRRVQGLILSISFLLTSVTQLCREKKIKLVWIGTIVRIEFFYFFHVPLYTYSSIVSS